MKVQRARWRARFLGGALSLGALALPVGAAEPPISCDFLLTALGTISLSELERAVESDRPLERGLLSCLEKADAPARLIDAVRRRQGKASGAASADSLEVDRTEPGWPEQVGVWLGDLSRMVLPGSRPVVVMYDPDGSGAAPPWWYQELRDRVASALLERLPEGSQAAEHPEVLDDDAFDLLDRRARPEAERRLARMGFRVVLVIEESGGLADEQVAVRLSLRELDAKGFGVDRDAVRVRVRPKPVAPPPPEEPVEPVPSAGLEGPARPPARESGRPEGRDRDVQVRVQLGMAGAGPTSRSTGLLLGSFQEGLPDAFSRYLVTERQISGRSGAVRVPLGVTVAAPFWRAGVGVALRSVPDGARARWYPTLDEVPLEVNSTFGVEVFASLQGGVRLGRVGLYGGLWGGWAQRSARADALQGQASGSFPLRRAGGLFGPQVSVDVALVDRLGLTAELQSHVLARPWNRVALPFTSGGLHVWVRL